MSQYRVGTVSVTNNSSTVTSDGTTTFTTNISAGQFFTISTLGVDNPVYEIAGVTDDSTFTLTAPYAGTSQTNQNYVIVRDFTPNLGLPLISKGSIETASIMKQALTMLDQNFEIDADIVSATTGQVLEYNGSAWANKLLDTAGTITTGIWNGTTIGTGYGGTGITTSPTNGELLIGNGSGYTASTLTAGTAISVTNGSGTITIANSGVTSNVAGSGISVSGATGAVTITNSGVLSNVAGSGISVSGSTGNVTIGNTGVLSITGTSHQVIASASTGAITLSLPQSIDTTSSPTFASITVSNAPSASTDATNKAYVDSVAQGLEVKQAARVTSASNITISNPGVSTIDGVTLASGDRVLLQGQTTTSQNGLWVFNGSSSAMTRPSDFDGSVDGTTVTDWSGSCVFVSQGTTYGNCFYVLTTANPITIDTTGQTWTQFGGPGTYTAGTGLSLSGGEFSNTGVLSLAGTASVIDVSGSTGNITINIDDAYVGQTSITTLGTITSGTWHGTAINLSTYATGTLPASNGGTGVNNGTSTITLGGNLTLSGAYTTTLNLTGNTSVTLPTSGTLISSTVSTLSSLVSVGTITTGTWNGTTVAANYGGTGQVSYTVGDLLYANTTTSLAKLSAAASGAVLTSNGTGVAPSWNTAAGYATFASPTNTVGLSAINGSATSAMRSDAAPALDQSISPTWTGTHTFTQDINVPEVDMAGDTPQFTLTGSTTGQIYSFGYNNGSKIVGFWDETGSAWRLYINDTTGVINIPTNVASTSPTTGAVVIAGGVGISGALNIGSAIELNGSAGTSGQVLTSAGSGTLPTWNSIPPTYPSVYSASVSGSYTVNWNNGGCQVLTLTGNTTLSFSNPYETGYEVTYTLRIIQGGSGSYTITWPTSGTGKVNWNQGNSPTLTTTVGQMDIFCLLTVNGGSTYSAGQVMADVTP